ncbi:30S ribosomal protein S16 [Candidatus Dependentiae bacterium]
MAVKIRLSRIGKKHRPYWRIVAVDSRAKRDGKFIDNLGTYDPLNHKLVTFKSDGIKEWIAKGAECSNAVIKLTKMHGKIQTVEAQSKS